MDRIREMRATDWHEIFCTKHLKNLRFLKDETLDQQISYFYDQTFPFPSIIKFFSSFDLVITIWPQCPFATLSAFSVSCVPAFSNNRVWGATRDAIFTSNRKKVESNLRNTPMNSLMFESTEPYQVFVLNNRTNLYLPLSLLSINTTIIAITTFANKINNYTHQF